MSLTFIPTFQIIFLIIFTKLIQVSQVFMTNLYTKIPIISPIVPHYFARPVINNRIF